MTRSYHLPGLHVTERTVTVPLRWGFEGTGDPVAGPSGEIDLFVREVVDPDKRHDDLPLLVFLQGGPGGACPRPLDASGWIGEAVKTHRVVMPDQRGTGRSTPVDAASIAELPSPRAAADHLACLRADSIVRDLEHLRVTVYGGRRWASLGQSYGGWITLAYLSTSPEALTACYLTGGVPGVPASAEEVYRHTFERVEAKVEDFQRRFPHDVEALHAVADRLAEGDVHLPDGDLLTVERLQSVGIDLGMGPGAVRLHWLLETAFAAPGRLSASFLEAVMVATSSASAPLFWTLQESIYGDGDNGPTAWAAQRERDRRPQFDPARRPLLLTGEMAFPWMFEQVRLLAPFGPAVHELAARPRWSPLYDTSRLVANEVPVAAAVYDDDMYVDSRISRATLRGLGASRAWVTNEYEHDGLEDPRVLRRLRELVRDEGGERR